MRSRPFLVLYAAVLVATMGISMVSPLLPVYAKELGASGIWIGLTFSIFAISQTAISPFAGGWSDSHGRRPFIIAGLLLYLVSALGYLTASGFLQVLAFRALSGFGTSLIFSVARAYIGDIVPEGREGRWFGVFATADVMGFGVGPLFAGSIRQAFGFDAVFIGMAALMAASAAIVWLLLPAHEPPHRASGLPRGGLASFRALNDRMVLALTFNMALISLTFGSTLSFLAVRLEGLGIDPLLTGVAFTMQSVASGISQPPLGYLADTTSRRNVVACGLVLASVMLFVLGVAGHFGVILALLFGMGIGSSASAAGSGAMQVAVGRRVGMGTVIGLGSAGNGIGILLGGLVGGYLVGRFGTPSAAFYFGAAVMLAGTPFFLWLTHGRPEAQAPARPGGELVLDDAVRRR